MDEEETRQAEVCIAKFTNGQPFRCPTLKKRKKKKGFKKPTKQKSYEIDCEYNFDISKANKIFDQLVTAGQLTLIGDHKLPSTEEIIRKQYCKWHNSWSYTMNSYVIFKIKSIKL